MKVGILTYHDTVNYGAALQAYATQAALTNMGVYSEFIDYINEHRRGNYSVQKRFFNQLRQGQFLSSIKTLVGMPMILGRTKRFAIFYRTYLKMGPISFRTRRSLWEAPLDYDVYLVGSDQVWNYRNNGSDFNYMLDFVSNKHKTVSYASSFGIESIPEELKEEYTRTLKEIRFLSVREKKGAALVNQLIDRDVPVVLDPVFLIGKDYWLELAKNDTKIKNKYIVNYTSKTDYISRFCAGTDYDIHKNIVVQIGSALTISDVLNQKVRILSAAGPEQFLGLIKNADLVLTSSFHGIAFSILMEKAFVAFLSGDEGRDSRIVDLLSSLGLSDRIFNSKMTEDTVEREINYKVVNQRLSTLRKKSISFFHNTLQQISRDQSTL